MNELTLTVLGNATPYPTRDNPCSGYLVTNGDTRVWMDAGTGTLGPLQHHTGLAELTAIWISHAHADHTADLLTAYYALRYADIDRDPLPLYCPPGLADRLANFLTNGPERSPVESAFAIHELHDGHQVQLGELTLTSRAVDHGIPAFGVRVESPEASLVFSGDTAACPALTELASGCDLLLCEAESDQRPADEPPVHHTPEDAGETAQAAGARRLLLTHLGRSVSPDDAVTRAAARFAGPVEFAEPGSHITV
ncbi:MBL fold metallo-hydrolase [Crossiella cryophila]|uniref:Ribonuclease BN (tRNA processing enzyme) n=1 Tax=Crossiella cryophila TaxID=43355 RepID=A0A7W7CCZ0_9PSEU|nr:MBL fold metallo-hydrolase [Crossiella cryophila]MBB4678824.1 ribonuclease BN (tRNA processing enzyme) [Crossiella cryophila]